MIKIDTNNVVLTPINFSIKIKYDNIKIILPQDIQDEVNFFWASATKANPHLTRGIVFHIVEIDDNNHFIRVQASDYAHYLWTVRNDKKTPYDCKIIFTGAIVRTCDDVLVFGEMAEHTAAPHLIQCVGGGIDASDVVEGGISIENAMRRELKEEFFTDIDDKDIVKSVKPRYLKSGGDNDFLAVIYEIKLKIDIDCFEQNYREKAAIKTENGQTPEFISLGCLPTNKESIIEILDCYKSPRNDYLNILLLRELELMIEEIN